MTRHAIHVVILLIAFVPARSFGAEDHLRREFLSPPDSAKSWCYWWWLNGAASKEGITRDFEEMKKQGIAGALLFDAGEAGPGCAARAGVHEPRVARALQACRARGRPLRHRADREPLQRLERRRPVGDPRARREEARLGSTGRQRAGACRGHAAETAGRAGVLSRHRRVGGPRRGGCHGQCKLAASSQYQRLWPRRWPKTATMRPAGSPTATSPAWARRRRSRSFCNSISRSRGRPPACYMKPYPDCGPKDVEVQCSDDGRTFRPLARATLKPREEKTLAFDEDPRQAFPHPVSVVASLPRWRETGTCRWPRSPCCRRISVAGQETPGSTPLEPQPCGGRDPVRGRKTGDWTGTFRRAVGRFCASASTLHGNMHQVRRLRPGGAGDRHDERRGHGRPLRRDRREADRRRRAAGRARRCNTSTSTVGNWASRPGRPKMREEFQQRRGYDPLPWLPAVVGQTVDNPQSTRGSWPTTAARRPTWWRPTTTAGSAS